MYWSWFSPCSCWFILRQFCSYHECQSWFFFNQCTQTDKGTRQRKKVKAYVFFLFRSQMELVVCWKRPWNGGRTEEDCTEAQKWAKHTELGRVWGVGKFQGNSDSCKPLFSIPFSCHFPSLVFAEHRQYPVLKKTFPPAAKSSQNPTRDSWRALCVRNISSADLQAHDRDSKKKIVWNPEYAQGVSKLYAESLQNCHTVISWVFCCYTVAVKPSRPFRKLLQLLALLTVT